MIGMILVILAFIFDRSIHNYFALSELKKFSEFGDRSHRNTQKVRLDLLQSISNPDKEVLGEINDIKKQLGIK